MRNHSLFSIGLLPQRNDCKSELTLLIMLLIFRFRLDSQSHKESAYCGDVLCCEGELRSTEEEKRSSVMDNHREGRQEASTYLRSCFWS